MSVHFYYHCYPDIPNLIWIIEANVKCIHAEFKFYNYSDSNIDPTYVGKHRKRGGIGVDACHWLSVRSGIWS